MGKHKKSAKRNIGKELGKELEKEPEGNRDGNWMGDGQVALTCGKVMCCAVWNKINSMQEGVSTAEIWIPKDVKTSESETVDGQNIQTLQHALC